MADTAAFFAKKKKVGKKFKSFNANKIDLSKVTSTTHIDAPAVSTGVEKLSISNNANDNNGLAKPVPDNDISINGMISTDGGDKANGSSTTKDNDAWEDMQIGGSNKNSYRSSNSKGTNTVELLDMKALESKRREQDDVAERMRVEETKAKLAAAREGMEKEALRLKEEKTFKTVKKPTSTSNRFGAAAANMGSANSGSSGPGRWVPSSRRNVGGSTSLRSDHQSMVNTHNNSSDGTGFQKKVDTDDQELFPDLATADKILAKEEELFKKQQKRITAKKSSSNKPVWGKPKTTATTAKAVDPPKPATTPVVETKPTPPPAATPAPDAASTTSTDPAPAAPALKKKKKKKKDLSTFKSSA